MRCPTGMYCAGVLPSQHTQLEFAFKVLGVSDDNAFVIQETNGVFAELMLGVLQPRVPSAHQMTA